MLVHGGNEDLFRRVYAEFADPIFRYCWFRIYNREEAIDAMQEVFLKFWRSLEAGNVVQNNKAFLYKIATNYLINLHRKKKTVSLEDMAEKGFDVPFEDEGSRVDVLDGARAIERLGELDPKYRDVVILRFVEGLGPREMAEIIGESENVISVRLNRAIKKLRILMKIDA